MIITQKINKHKMSNKHFFYTPNLYNEQAEDHNDANLLAWLRLKSNGKLIILPKLFWKESEKGYADETKHGELGADHDNVPCHNALSFNKNFTTKNIAMVPPDTYFPDVSLSSSFLPK